MILKVKEEMSKKSKMNNNNDQPIGVNIDDNLQFVDDSASELGK